MQITVLSLTKKTDFLSVQSIFNWEMFVTARKKKDNFQGQVHIPQSVALQILVWEKFL
jgi:formylmethanofuran dehydrogenase subunit D